jgi:hypothetical protein
MSKRSREYKRFLRSDSWKRIRARYRSELPWVCFVCGSSRRLQLHHLTYVRFGGDERNEDLRPLCRDHHLEVHERTRRVRSDEQRLGVRVLAESVEVIEGQSFRRVVLAAEPPRRPRRRRA